MNSGILLGLEILGGVILLFALVLALSHAFKYDLFYDKSLGEEDEGGDLTIKKSTNQSDDDDIIHRPSI
jgi:hypothetical protein